MKAFIRLIRLPNLIFIVWIQYLVQYFVLVPILQYHGIQSALPTGGLTLLILATVLITAGGYVINDYFDQRIDAINKPDRKVVGNAIKPEKSMLLHQTLSIAGVFLGLLLSWWVRDMILAVIFIITPGILWYYSASYKRKFMTGNLAVGYLTAMTVIVVGMANISMLKKEYGTLIFDTPVPMWFYLWIGGLAIFAFLTTWIREIIKDLEDISGDKALECRTMPIVWGDKKTRYFASFLIWITLGTLLLADQSWIPFKQEISSWYITAGLIIPLLIFQVLLLKANKTSDYKFLSFFIKLIMLIGVSYTIVFKYLIALL